MNIRKEIIDDKLVLYLEGRLDTSNSAELEKVINESIESVNNIEVDLSDLEYMSSSGLRVFLVLQKMINAKGGKLVVCHVNEYIMEIFEITGFSNILTIV